MARQKKPEQRDIEQYKHENQQRVNNPPIGLVNPDTDPEEDAKKYAQIVTLYYILNSKIGANTLFFSK